jgi:hypothetical protein
VEDAAHTLRRATPEFWWNDCKTEAVEVVVIKEAFDKIGEHAFSLGDEIAKILCGHWLYDSFTTIRDLRPLSAIPPFIRIKWPPPTVSV